MVELEKIEEVKKIMERISEGEIYCFNNYIRSVENLKNNKQKYVDKWGYSDIMSQYYSLNCTYGVLYNSLGTIRDTKRINKKEFHTIMEVINLLREEAEGYFRDVLTEKEKCKKGIKEVKAECPKCGHIFDMVVELEMK